jgi:hypothetical protein
MHAVAVQKADVIEAPDVSAAQLLCMPRLSLETTVLRVCDNASQ